MDNAAYYEIELKEGDVQWAQLEEGPQEGTGISLRLPIEVEYSFRVRAVNSRGDGPWSDVLSVTLGELTTQRP